MLLGIKDASCPTMGKRALVLCVSDAPLIRRCDTVLGATLRIHFFGVTCNRVRTGPSSLDEDSQEPDVFVHKKSLVVEGDAANQFVLCEGDLVSYVLAEDEGKRPWYVSACKLICAYREKKNTFSLKMTLMDGAVPLTCGDRMDGHS
jgi:hypothetical protein